MQFEWDREKANRTFGNTGFPLTKQSPCFMIPYRPLSMILITLLASGGSSRLVTPHTECY